MSCCPPAPPINTTGSAPNQNSTQESDIQPGESLECYAARSGNQSGKLDDATENVPGKIENTSIPINASNASVNVTFRLTSGSPTPAASWTLTRNGTPWAISGVIFTSNGTTASLVGPFPIGFHKESFEVLLSAFDAGGTLIDARSFKFSPTIATRYDSIQLVSPLPGAIVNSKFGPRLHPIHKVMKLHSGIDMKFADRSVANVVAAADGEVIFAGINGTLRSGYGYCVKIRHLNGSGQTLCTTLYGHLAKIYVTVSQKVSAKQPIGLEGTTGSSTGNHLHFELRLPNNTPIDPVPYIRGGVGVADTTTPSGDPGNVSQVAGGAAVTQAGNAAIEKPCPAPGVDPLTGTPIAPPPNHPPPVGNDPFEKAWFFTMKWEVGPHWMSTPQYSPGDSELDAGLYDTSEQRKKTGYKNWPGLGGITKFGVAQDPNRKRVVVNDLTYVQAKSFGRTNYWEGGGPVNCTNKGELFAIMLFDIRYLHGDGGARTVLTNYSPVSVPALGASEAAQRAACEQLHAAVTQHVMTLKPTVREGWLNRTNDRIAYIRSLAYPIA
jgi:murein DD-endopeptidase MepM/ murein hydrolase activator NlpD